MRDLNKLNSNNYVIDIEGEYIYIKPLNEKHTYQIKITHEGIIIDAINMGPGDNILNDILCITHDEAFDFSD